MGLLCKREYSYISKNEPEKIFTDRLSAMLRECYKNNKTPIFLCIGTDRATGDALGPLVGSYISDRGVENVFGTVDEPVHAENLRKYIEKININFENGFIVAIDASLGKSEQIGGINLWEGPLHPGSGVSKILGSVGDISITGVVNKMSYNPMFQLQNTRLSLVMKMAEIIGKAICTSV